MATVNVRIGPADNGRKMTLERIQERTRKRVTDTSWLGDLWK